MSDKQLYDVLTKLVQVSGKQNKPELLAYLYRTAPEEMQHKLAGCDCCCYDCCTHM